jgi:hypothetical protein
VQTGSYTVFILSQFRGDYRRGLDWWMDLLTTYKHDSELHTITALSLIYIPYKSLQHPLRLFQPAVSSAVPWQRLLAVQILQLQALRSYLHKLPYTTVSTVNWTHYYICPGYNTSARTTQKTPFFFCCFRVRCRGNVFTEPSPRNSRGADHRKPRSIVACMLRALSSNGRCLQSHCLATGLYGTIL